MTEKDYYKQLVRFLTNIQDEKLMEDFLDDLLTPAEKKELPKRLQVVKKLIQGRSQRSIAKELGVGIATVTRGSKELQGKKGGFRKVFGIN